MWRRRRIMRPARRASSAADASATPDWRQIAEELDAYGCAVIGNLLADHECAALAASYADDARFRSRIVMGAHGFGRGEYKYFAYPLPAGRRHAAPRALPAARRDREPVGRGARDRGPLSRRPRRLSRALPRGRADQADAAAAAVRRRRLQLPAPGPLRRARVPAAGRDPALASRGATSPAASSC